MAPKTTLTFLGAAGTVTGSKYVLTYGDRRVMVDAGMFQGEKQWREMNWAEFPIDPATISDIVLTHAHIDHCGYLPALVAKGFGGTVWVTEGTLRLAEIVLMDAGYLQEREAQRAEEGGYSKHNPPLPLYTVADVEKTLPLLRVVPYDTDINLGGGIGLRMTRAGHILGSACVTLRVDGASVLFSGDLGRHEHRILRARETPPGSPYVLVESTYGDREHPDPAGLDHEDMADAIRRTIARGGSVLIPAFAVDRTPAVLKALGEMRKAGRIPEVPIFVNSPMAVAALAVYRDAEQDDELNREVDPIDFADLPNLREVADAEESKALNHPKQPCIIVSSSGMATGGRVLHHLEAMLPSARNTIIFTGYQGAGTRGRDLLEGAVQMKFRGRFIPVKAEIVRDTEFSVHADASDLIDWLRDLEPKPETVFCVHGEEGSAEALAERIHAELGLVAHVPKYKEVVKIDPSGQWEPLPELSAPPAMRVPARARDIEPDVDDSVEPVTVRATPSAPLPAPRATAAGAGLHDDDAEQIEIILDTAIGQVPFLPTDKQADVSALLRDALAVARTTPLDAARVREATNLALYAAAGAVETPGGQSIVALLAHVPKVLG
jgi:metallo-beta-lactamase family protein